MKAAIATYNKTVGPSWYSKVHTAERAAGEIEMAYSSGASGLVSLDMSALINDFNYLTQAAFGEDISRYNVVRDQTNTDIQTLNTDCNPG